MKLDQNEKPDVLAIKDTEIAPRSSSRRQFLQKSSATVLMTSLAAQPVWGGCKVSGAMSGGSATKDQDDDPCRIPHVGGRPPSFWGAVKGKKGGSGKGPGSGPGGKAGPSLKAQSVQTNAALADAFPWVGDVSALEDYVGELKASSFFTVAATPGSPAEIVNVGSAIESPGSVYYHLAAIWLNAYFGFFRGEPLPGGGEGAPQDWVDHFHALSVRDTLMAQGGSGGWGNLIFESVYEGHSQTEWNELP